MEEQSAQKEPDKEAIQRNNWTKREQLARRVVETENKRFDYYFDKYSSQFENKIIVREKTNESLKGE